MLRREAFYALAPGSIEQHLTPWDEARRASIAIARYSHGKYSIAQHRTLWDEARDAQQ